WFLDKGKKNTNRADKVLFIDARHIYRQIDRAHRDFTPEQQEFLANIARLYRGEEPELLQRSEALLKEQFPEAEYTDVPGLCKVATIEDVEANGWSLNPGRYVGVADGRDDTFDFLERFAKLSDEFQTLSAEASQLTERINQHAALLLSEDL